jgi:hypothetical protein
LDKKQDKNEEKNAGIIAALLASLKGNPPGSLRYDPAALSMRFLIEIYRRL